MTRPWTITATVRASALNSRCRSSVMCSHSPAPLSPGTCSIRRSRDTFIQYRKRPIIPLARSDCDLQLLYWGRTTCQGGDVEPRSGCPINAAIEVLGDRWSLLVLRDVIFGDRRYFRALLTGSMEGIAS